MPMHDWTRVDAGTYHMQHHNWITMLHRSMKPLLPKGYYAMPEQRATLYGPDILTLEKQPPSKLDGNGGAGTLVRPKAKIVEETLSDYFLRKQNAIAIRHVSGDRLVAVIEIVSPGYKKPNYRYRNFVKKSRGLLERRIHMLIVDPFPAPKR